MNVNSFDRIRYFLKIVYRVITSKSANSYLNSKCRGKKIRILLQPPLLQSFLNESVIKVTD